MKLSMVLAIFISFNLLGAELGEDPSNVECTKSIHGSRPFLATVKQPEAPEEEKERVKGKEIKTIQK
jgi:hypothetical protein